MHFIPRKQLRGIICIYEVFSVRLDKFLKVSRLIKRRTVAKSAVETDHVLVNGKAVKPSYDVKIHDVLTLHFGEREIRVKVLQLSDHVGQAEASSLYEIVTKE